MLISSPVVDSAHASFVKLLRGHISCNNIPKGCGAGRHSMLKPDVEIKVMVTRTMADALGDLAARQDLSEGAIVREALRRLLEAEEKKSSVAAIESQDSSTARSPWSIENVRRIVVSAVSASHDWKDLNYRLSTEGLELAPKGGGLVVRSLSPHKDICKASTVCAGHVPLI